MEKISVLISGKLGDLIHSLYVCNVLFKHFDKKCIIYMTDSVEPFENGLENTYMELYETIKMQPFCAEFKIWNGEPVEVNTTLFRRSNLLYKNCWREIFNESFNTPILTGAWLEYHNPKINQNTLVISRRYKTPLSQNAKYTYLNYIQQFENIVFLGSQYDYDLFDLKHYCKLVTPLTIDDWLINIKTSGYFIGNQSSPLAMALALDVNALGELFQREIIDYVHYVGEEKYSQKFNYFLNE
jgi:hypothetical protein